MNSITIVKANTSNCTTTYLELTKYSYPHISIPIHINTLQASDCFIFSKKIENTLIYITKTKVLFT